MPGDRRERNNFLATTTLTVTMLAGLRGLVHQQDTGAPINIETRPRWYPGSIPGRPAMRKTLWAIAIIAALLVIWLYLDWQRGKREAADVTGLTSEINKAADDIDKALAVKLPADAGFIELSWYQGKIAAINKRTEEFVPVMRDYIMKTKGNNDAPFREFREAVDAYHKKAQLIGPRLNEVQKRIDEIKAKQS